MPRALPFLQSRYLMLGVDVRRYALDGEILSQDFGDG